MNPSATDRIPYGTSYYVRAKVWDQHGDSGWSAIPTTFITAAHAWPYPQFSFSPLVPVVGSLVTFLDSSICYYVSGASYSCQNGDGITYSWIFGDGQVGSDKGNTYHTYNISGSYSMKLKVDDPEVGYCLTSPNNILVKSGGSGLPKWREIAPF